MTENRTDTVMDEGRKYRVLIIESDESRGRQVIGALEKQGYRTQWARASMEGLAILEKKEELPFSLVISSLKMPKMGGDEILVKAREISPHAQRMLMVDFSEIETVIRAVNNADIHSCLPVPFTDDVLINHVERCCGQYDKHLKRMHLKKVTRDQNKQMYALAKHFKSKEEQFSLRIRKKKKIIELLKAELITGPKAGKEGPLSLAAHLGKTGVETTPDGYFQEFKRLGAKVRVLIEKTAGELGLHVKDIKPKTGNKEPDDYGVLIPLVLSESMRLVQTASGPDSGSTGETGDEEDGGECLEVSFSEDRVQAFLALKTRPADALTTADVLSFLAENDVRFGIVDDALITGWLTSVKRGDPPLLIAKGVYPKQPEDARVTYHFETDFQHAGKVLPDGSIDFRDRGDIPFVSAETLLAEKNPPASGVPGTDVHGATIEVPEPLDVTFLAGSGTRFSDDQLSIIADTGGQPHLDAMGNVSVFAELNIKGDVDFETGNINFNGNVIVEGVVKEGFKVKGASLTAAQIEGAEIDLTGDLNVESGIIDTQLIKVQGSVQAKYVNNSTIKAFGDLIIQKEIIDSRISISGACINETGTIIASKIAAKRGIQAGAIGTEVSGTSSLKVGVDEYLNGLLAAIDRNIAENLAAAEAVKHEIADLEKRDQELNEVISEKAYVQDRSQVELRDIEKQLAALEASGDIAAVKRMTVTVRQLSTRAKEAEEQLNKAFENQDRIAADIENKQGIINRLEERNAALVFEKKQLKELSYKTPASPVVIVNKRIMPGTVIEAEHSVVKIKDPVSRCRIQEVRQGGGDDNIAAYYTMEIMPQ